MKKLRRVLITCIIAGIVYIGFNIDVTKKGHPVEDSAVIFVMEDFEHEQKAAKEKLPIRIYRDGLNFRISAENAYIEENQQIMIESSSAGELLDCAVLRYSDEKLIIEKDDQQLEIAVGTKGMAGGQEQNGLAAWAAEDTGKIFVSLEDLAWATGFSYESSADEKTVWLTADEEMAMLPSAYDYRQKQRAPQVKNQGSLGTCWAIASLSAMESSLLPSESMEFAADHMTLHNSFASNQYDGGDYTMSMAYLTSWQGPVLEADDPYGDEHSPAGLTAVKHVQEIQSIKKKDYEGIKEAIYKYGAVQSSLYLTLEVPDSESVYYSRENSAYGYKGEEQANHDIIIIGWDDEYSADNFNPEAGIRQDGAFICQNSWGESFGEAGIFYVSYEDTNIGIYNAVYTDIQELDNYDNIYQSDLCGWIGQIGYEQEQAFFANVYETSSDELLRAIGFYATDNDTQYNIYFVENFTDEESLNDRELIQSGAMKNAGFYTVDLVRPIALEAASRYAFIVEITVPGSIYPVAIEYQADELSAQVDLSDGEGYLSLYGDTWMSTEAEYDCNVCLKVYSDIAP